MRAINFFKLLSITLGWQIALLSFANLTVNAQEAESKTEVPPDRVHKQLDLPQDVIESSPTLQRWLKETPDLWSDIKHDPSFRTRLRWGITSFPSSDGAVGLNLGVEDIFIERTGLTISVDYQTAFNGDRNAVGADLHYFVLPLGGYVNLAPMVGYRYVQSNDFNTDGVNVGLRLMLTFSRTGAGDISFSQSFLSPGGSEEVGLTSLSVGYAVTPQLRLSTDLEWQNSIEDNDSRAGINLEFLL